MLLTACSNIVHSLHLAKGQLDIITQAQSIDKLMMSQNLDVTTRRRLRQVQAVLRFAEDELLLDSATSYRRYVDLDREHVIWNVFAAPEFSLQPRQWCYPIAGCVPYRAYFDMPRADRYAQRLQHQQLDVYVGAVDAYSTLGWFKDPILSSWLNRPQWSVVATLIHELAHSVVYIEDDPAFNESFASFVEQQGVRRWFVQYPEDAGLAEYQRQQVLQSELDKLIDIAKRELLVVYDSSQPDEVKRSNKKLVLDALTQHSYRLSNRSTPDLETKSGSFRIFNNALLAAHATYNQWLPAFDRLFNSSGSWSSFYQSVRRLEKLTHNQRQQQLTELSRTAM